MNMAGVNKYVALLRGINVGGNNLIKMADLKACFEKEGYENVRTYIQSGNVLFESPETNVANLTKEIERVLGETFNYKPVVVVRSLAQLKQIVAKAPRGFGSDPAKYRYDAIFLKEPITVKEAMAVANPKEGVDTAHAGDGVLYFSRLIAKATSSHLQRIVGTPEYQSMTIRNWNTTNKLLKMMEES